MTGTRPGTTQLIDSERSQSHLSTAQHIQQSGEQLGTGGWIFLVFHQNHENIAEAPQHNILEGNPAQQRHKAQDAPHILRVFDVAEGELHHPRDLLPEPDAIVGTRLAEQLVHPEGKPHFSEAG